MTELICPITSEECKRRNCLRASSKNNELPCDKKVNELIDYYIQYTERNDEAPNALDFMLRVINITRKLDFHDRSKNRFVSAVTSGIEAYSPGYETGLENEENQGVDDESEEWDDE